MVKKKKTRAEKILADSRHFPITIDQITTQVRLPSVSMEIQTPRMAQTTTFSYDYVLTDLRKTLFITFFILLSQIILFFALQRI